MARGGNPNSNLAIDATEHTGDPVRLKVPGNTKEFYVKPDPAGTGNVLIHPTQLKRKWKKSELWHRSVILGPDGRVLSMSLPKFRNVGEDEVETADFVRRIESGEHIDFTEKMDGSLAIRSVVNGQVVWRTRGTWDGGAEHGPPIRKVAEQFPVLADPEFLPGHSLHFEFVHPNFPIIINYPKPDLILLSGVDHHDLRLLKYEQIQQLAHENDLSLVPLHELPTDFKQLQAAVDQFEGCEGIVARYADEQKYVKMKGLEYLKQHRLRFSFGLRETLRHCFEHDFADEAAFSKYLTDMEMDWEVLHTLTPIYRVYEEGRKRARAEEAEVMEFVDFWCNLIRDDRRHERSKKHARLDDRAARKEYVAEAKAAFGVGPLFNGAMALGDDDHRAARWRSDRLKDHVEDALRASRLPVDDE